MRAALPEVRLVYMIRDPVERTVSHYIHEWSTGVMTADMAAVIDLRTETGTGAPAERASLNEGRVS